ncbi:MAG: acetoin utilization protein AcuC [Desulfarculaceae bacterium]|nr:acetoin utilization protein AcuC [Desulfarculaceae bacterium]
MAPNPSRDQPAYLYSDEFQRFDYGPEHPMRVRRLAMTHELLGLLGMEPPCEPFSPAGMAEMMLYHDRRYLETLRELSACPETTGYIAFGLGPGDNPVFPGVYDWSALLAGATLAATRLVAEEGAPAAFTMAGGMHHALAARAAGFCYINDAVLAIRRLVAKGKRVAYVDLDAHHGDGVQWAFYDSDQVLTISLHQHPATLFPGTGFLEEMGREQGKGYCVNLPLWPDTDDDVYMIAFEQVVPPLIEAFQPDYVVSQMGVDTFLADPLANLNLTTRGFGHAARRLKNLAWGRWIVLGGGGYHLVNVARAWTLLWAILSDQEDRLPVELPGDFALRHMLRGDESQLLDDDTKLRGRHWHRAQRDAAEAVEFIKKNHFPILGA